MDNILENKYQQYLRLVGLNENNLPPIQKQELRRAFMAGCGQTLEILTEFDFAKVSPIEVAEVIIKMDDEVKDFFKKEIEKDIMRKKELLN